MSDKDPADLPTPTTPTPTWTPEQEIALFHALTKFRPVGVHKHFRMLSVQRFVAASTGVSFTIAQLWAHLATFYELDALDAMADETDDDITFEARRRRSGYPFKVVAEFQLPSEEFENLIVEQRKAASPTPVESTPEPEEEDKAPPATAPAKRGVGRPRKATKKEQPLSEPPMRRTRAASGSAAVTNTPTPATKRPRRNA
ncbi:chromatin modification-related protein EAF7-domain-containing protein [Powellomyces hirtus]|nr:chromatin modification-related protein EAF7-domain-containing protein [Powellomyces hirtus]